MADKDAELTVCRYGTIACSSSGSRHDASGLNVDAHNATRSRRSRVAVRPIRGYFIAAISFARINRARSTLRLMPSSRAAGSGCGG